ncbi:hypothetical protein VPH35_082689 [Triticum aestivum]
MKPTVLYKLAIIMTLNSSKERTPSPLRSNLQIMALHSSSPIFSAPSSLPSIRLRLAGVILAPCSSPPPVAYIANASLRHRRLTSSSSPPAAPPSSPAAARPIRENSSWSSSPSPSASTVARIAAASSSDTSSPSAAVMEPRSSAADTLPSPSLSKAANTDDACATASATIRECSILFACWLLCDLYVSCW